MENIWLKVTDDKYELPIAVADTAEELGILVGTTRESIISAVYHSKKEGFKSCYKKSATKRENWRDIDGDEKEADE